MLMLIAVGVLVCAQMVTTLVANIVCISVPLIITEITPLTGVWHRLTAQATPMQTIRHNHV